jgi:hypothetical protein
VLFREIVHHLVKFASGISHDFRMLKTEVRIKLLDKVMLKCFQDSELGRKLEFLRIVPKGI